jgi:hypothetical protein
MQPATHLLDPGAEAEEHIRLEIDVTELNHASPGCTNEPAMLPLDLASLCFIESRGIQRSTKCCVDANYDGVDCLFSVNTTNMDFLKCVKKRV